MPVFSKKLGSINANDPNTIRLLANHIRIMQEELEYRLSVLDSSNISEIDTDVTKVYSIEADEKIVLSVGDINKKYTELKVAVDGVTITDETGTTKIKGSSIETGSLVLTGTITFSDLDNSTQSKINNAGGISSSQATTLITSTLVSSPTIMGANIFGGTFWDDEGEVSLVLNNTGSGHADLDLKSGNEVVFNIYDGIDFVDLSGKGLKFLRVSTASDATYALGDWHFSGNVTGVTATFA